MLTQLLASADTSARKNGLLMASEMGEERALPFAHDIAALLSDPEPTIRAQAIRTLGEIRADAYATPVARILSTPGADVSMKRAATVALSKMGRAGVPHALAVFELLTTTADEHLRHTAAVVLARMSRHAQAQVGPLLVQLMRSDNLELRALAVRVGMRAYTWVGMYKHVPGNVSGNVCVGAIPLARR